MSIGSDICNTLALKLMSLAMSVAKGATQGRIAEALGSTAKQELREMQNVPPMVEPEVTIHGFLVLMPNQVVDTERNGFGLTQAEAWSHYCGRMAECSSGFVNLGDVRREAERYGARPVRARLIVDRRS